MIATMKHRISRDSYNRVQARYLGKGEGGEDDGDTEKACICSRKS
jgi:hypothetical protein